MILKNGLNLMIFQKQWQLFTLRAFGIATNGSRLCAGWGFEFRLPNQLLKLNRITNDEKYSVSPTCTKPYVSRSALLVLKLVTFKLK